MPQFADELLAAVRKTVFKFCERHNGEEAEARRFFKALQDEAFLHARDLSDSVAVSACLIWTSQLRLTLRGGRTLEFCGILNCIMLRKAILKCLIAKANKYVEKKSDIRSAS